MSYRKKIDCILENEMPKTEWESLLSQHLIEISFFQHERLIHLIVTALFAVLEFLSVILAGFTAEPKVLLLCAAIFVLLVPYVIHYYILENEVQKMYVQYDEILKRINSEHNK